MCQVLVDQFYFLVFYKYFQYFCSIPNTVFEYDFLESIRLYFIRNTIFLRIFECLFLILLKSIFPKPAETPGIFDDLRFVA